MTTRYTCNKVGDPCLSKDGADVREGFKGDEFCNKVCNAHVWKFTLDELIRRTQRVIATGEYHSQHGLNLDKFLETRMG
jgi:hypothetical protein